MRTDLPQRIYLKDYRPPNYLIEQVDLDISLHPTATCVRSKLSIRRNPDAGAGSPPLVLDGEKLELVSISLDGVPLSPKAYTLGRDSLTFAAVPSSPFTLEIETLCDPQGNSELSGLYLSGGVFCTQCEAEGFRRITYFLDRPDMLAVYTVRVEADRLAAPVLLSNGNPVGAGTLDGARHYAVWHDPFPKPSYLFALVGGKLANISDRFVTASGRPVALNIHTAPGHETRAAYAMDALKRAMRWDEERFGREYDLDVFNIVAVSDFNMGAMENKGLNIFNDKYVLASPETATDTDYANIEAIIAHEYFHNWTGNRITCRDWFQLCLKEGLTVFRDQEFSADMRSATVERIGDVRLLRNQQFAEDAGPLAHPVRPDSFIEINNFYTATVYEKGAELVRMLRLWLGREAFRKAMDLYFARHDGTAATVEDFLRCFEEAGGADLTQFRRWYAQAGTPELVAKGRYNARARTFTLEVEQIVPPTHGQPKKDPMHIPLALGLVGADGHDLPLDLEGGGGAEAGIVHVRERKQTFRFRNVPEAPVPSLLRGFSAPVRLTTTVSGTDLLFLLTHDKDLFNRWQAAQGYAMRLMLAAYHEGAAGQTAAKRKGSGCSATALADALRASLCDAALEPAYRAQLLELPSESDLAMSAGQDVDPDRIRRVREQVRGKLATALRAELTGLYEAHQPEAPYAPDAAGTGRRALRNAAMTLLVAAGDAAAAARAEAHYRSADNMTDRMAALSAIVHVDHPARASMLDDFHARFHDDALVLDKWFALQAGAALPGTLEHVRALMRHPAFALKIPNKVRALIGTFALSNPTGFHRADGEGYRFTAETVIALDRINPQVAARLLGAFRSWRTMEEQRRGHAEAALRVVAGSADLSRDVSEIAQRSLD